MLAFYAVECLHGKSISIFEQETVLVSIPMPTCRDGHYQTDRTTLANFAARKWSNLNYSILF